MTFNPQFPLLPYVIIVVVCALAFMALAFFQIRSTGSNPARWLRRGGIFALIALIGFGPSVLVETEETMRVNVDVYLVVDRTGSMAAMDYDGEKPRLDGVRADIDTLADDMSGARFSVVSFDSAATRQLPLTTDTGALRAWARTMNQEITVYSAGSNMNRALGELTSLLQQGRKNYPANKQIVFFMSDGENTSDEPVADFSALESLTDGGAILGYGTEKGARMKRYDPLLDKDSFVMDETKRPAKPAISTIDEKALRQVASEIGVPYLHRTAAGGLEDITKTIESQVVRNTETRTLLAPQLFVWPFAIAACALMIWELAAITTRATRQVG